jgi:hypothetical protein
MEIIIFIIAVFVVALFILPTKKSINVRSHYARPEGCTCPEYNRLSVKVDCNCPVHGDWAEPLYSVEEIKAYANKERTEREQRSYEAGLYVNHLLSEKWKRK